MVKSAIDWDNIDTVLLDMDGTLIDNYHENYFWDTQLPKFFAKKNKITMKDARKILFKKYRAADGTLAWSDMDYWSRETGINVKKARLSIKHLIKLHPHTLKFLKFLKNKEKKIYLVTASDPHDMDYKMARIRIGKYFEKMVSQAHIGSTKKEAAFWTKLRRVLKYKKSRTLLADDNESVLLAAEKHGIKYLVFKTKFSSKRAVKKKNHMICVHHFDDIISKN